MLGVEHYGFGDSVVVVRAMAFQGPQLSGPSR